MTPVLITIAAALLAGCVWIDDRLVDPDEPTTFETLCLMWSTWWGTWLVGAHIVWDPAWPVTVLLVWFSISGLSAVLMPDRVIWMLELFGVRVDR